MTNHIPDDLLNQHLAVLGKTGSGKSSALRTLIEVCILDQNKPFIGIDPKGDWWGLKSSSSGKRAGYPIVIFGGLHADVPINDRSGAHVAELLATGNRPAIVDLSQMLVGERTRFFIAFAESLYRHTRGMRWLMIDEVHNFAPKGKIFDVDAGKMLHWANKLASEGRGKGLQLMVASQRPQKVHNDLLDSCETLIAMRSVHPRAREAIKEWIDGAGDPEKGAEVLSTLSRMPRGTGWVWSPENDFGPRQVAFPMFRTFDSFKPQLHGSDKKLPGWASVDLGEVREKLAEVVKEAEANDPRMLKIEIAELKKKLATASMSTDRASGMSRAEAAAEYDRGTRDGRSDLAHSILLGVQKSINTMTDVAVALAEARERATKPKAAPRALKPADHGRGVGEHSATTPAVAARGSIDKPMPRAILTALAQHVFGLSKGKILVHTGYRSSGPVSQCFAELTRNGWIGTAAPGVLSITDEGLKALGKYEPLPIGLDLQEHLFNGSKLSLMEKRILKVICKQHPHDVTKSDILTETGYKSSGPVSQAFAHLVALGYARAEGRGRLKAADELFG